MYYYLKYFYIVWINFVLLLIIYYFFSVKPIQLVSCVLEIASPGKMPVGKTEIPFEAPLKPKANRTLYETYHGIFIAIQYFLKCDLKRSFLSKDVNKVAEFMVEKVRMFFCLYFYYYY